MIMPFIRLAFTRLCSLYSLCLIYLTMISTGAIAVAQPVPTADPSLKLPQKTPPPPLQIQAPNRIPNQVSQQVQIPPMIQQQQMNNSRSRPINRADLKKYLDQLPELAPKTYSRPQIQLALVLDVSGSMEGLLNQAREELWKVINLFNGVHYQGETPHIRVALYTHGMSQATTGLFLERQLSLTTDLDQVSEVLFSLKTTGSEEYCPSSLFAASRGLEWSSSPHDFKAIIIAGNEEFVQGPLSLKEGFIPGKKRGLITHTIHCGAPKRGIEHQWKAAAKLGGGQFLNIDQDAKHEYIETPYDDHIQELNSQLNQTYIPYGRLGKTGIAKQQAQDSNARKMSKSSAIQRSITKSNSYYSNDQWDLVDAVRKKTVDLSKIDAQRLPLELRSLDAQALTSYVQKKQNQRSEIHEKIAKLKKERALYLKQERAKRAASGQKRLDSVLIEALRAQALKLGFKWRTE